MSGKGSEFERTICRKLSLWWTNGELDDVFWRTATSGAMAHVRRKAGKRTFGQTGDIQAVDPIGQPFLDVFCVELKRGYSDMDFGDLLDGKGAIEKHPLTLFLDQAYEQADADGGKIPLLIVRRDRKEAVVFMPAQTAGDINPVINANPYIQIVVQRRIVVACSLENWLTLQRPDDVRKHAKVEKAAAELEKMLKPPSRRRPSLLT